MFKNYVVVIKNTLELGIIDDYQNDNMIYLKGIFSPFKLEELDDTSNGYIGIADISYTNGCANKCIIFDENGNRIDLRQYVENPLNLCKEYDKLHIQNEYTSIIIDTKDIKSINFEVKKVETDNK